ncbi:UNVERIFIED_CONTAM: hypothetical protein HHA_450820 [Hammondia hammondi]|eukprot:XP_008883274.1 hypothetical protein HHA_450820 [Hammondia hammondi]
MHVLGARRLVARRRLSGLSVREAERQGGLDEQRARKGKLEHPSTRDKAAARGGETDENRWRETSKKQRNLATASAANCGIPREADAHWVFWTKTDEKPREDDEGRGVREELPEKKCKDETQTP